MLANHKYIAFETIVIKEVRPVFSYLAANTGASSNNNWFVLCNIWQFNWQANR